MNEQKTKIGILTSCQYSVFSGGLTNPVIAYAELFRQLEYDVVIINVNKDVSWWDDCKNLESKFSVKTILKTDVFEDKLDILIETVPFFETEKQRRNFSKTSIVFFHKNILIPTIEHSLYPIVNKHMTYDGVKEIWCYDLFCSSDEKQILETISRRPVIILPYIWTPSIIEAYKEEHNLPLWLQFQSNIALQNEGKVPLWSPHVIETNLSSTSSCTIPLLILKETKVNNKVPFSSYKVHNAETIFKSPFFQENVYRHIQIPELTSEYVGRQVLIHHVMEPMSCIVHHSRFVILKPRLFELAWFGIPFIHNSTLLNTFTSLNRYYYPNNKISEGIIALERVHQDFLDRKGIFNVEHIQKFRTELLERYSSCNESICNRYKEHINSLININTTLPVIEIVEKEEKVVKNKKYILLFTDMWEAFNFEYNFFSLMLTEAIEKLDFDIEFCSEETLKGREPNTIIFGPFGSEWRKYPNIPKIHFTGENTPPVKEDSVKLNLGFGHSDMVGDDYLRFPLWILEIDWFHCDSEKVQNPKPIPLDLCRSIELNNRSKFCAFIVSNPSNSVRNSAFHIINSYKPVDSAGRLYNNIGDRIYAGLGGGGGELNKVEFLKDYKFCICYENSSSQGYTTEKLLHAKASGCIPIYWGDPKVERDFDKKGFIDARNVRSADELIALVKEIDENDEKYLEMRSVPALDSYRVEWARRTMSECAKRILTHLTGTIHNLPRFIGKLEKSSQVKKNSVELKDPSSDISVPILVTFVTREYLPSLSLWLNAFDAQKTILPTLNVIIYIGSDVSDESKKQLLETYPFIEFAYLPETVPDNFKDIWNPQHFAWKIYIYNELANRESIKGRTVLYLDAGIFLCRWTSTYLRLIQENDICVLEDEEQFNSQWCHEAMVKIMDITPHELSQHQIVGGILGFRAGSQKAVDYFKEAWFYALQRDVIVGEKWSGMRDGKPFGHRHDQSILSILSLRHKLITYPLHNLYCDVSLRRTFITNKQLYVHRGNFKVHEKFIDGIDECFILNLKRRSDRLERLWSNNLALKRRSAIVHESVEGKNIILTKEIARLFKPHDFMWKKAIMGCALSHLSLWHQLANEKPEIDNYLILEDDVKMQTDWEERWLKALPSIPEDYDIIYLGGILPPNKAGYDMLIEPINDHFSRVKENSFYGQQPPNRYFHVCAYSYILSKEGAKKVLAIIQARDGYYTSADHILCNPVSFLNIYYMNPLIAGCYQEEDPAYMASEFNNFNRVDTFDSDLWNNDERFTKEEVDGLEECELNIPLALQSISLKKIVKEEKKKEEYINKTTRFYTLDTHEVEWNLLYEHKWLEEMFQGITITIQRININDTPYIENPIFIVQKPHSDDYNRLFIQLETKGIKYSVLHLSDEHGLDNIRFYEYSCCLKIIRNYLRQGLNDKVLVIPLGYHHTVGNGIEIPYERTPQIPFRSLIWSFFGTDWKNRRELLEPLKAVVPHKVELYTEWNDEKSQEKSLYLSTLMDSIFIPCFGGQNSETFRLYEALECGCIPIIVQTEENREYVEFLSKHLEIFPIKSWNEAVSVMIALMNDKPSLESYRYTILSGYRTMKKYLQQQVKNALMI